MGNHGTNQNNKTTELTSNTNKQFLVFKNSKTNEIGTFIKVGKKGDKFVYGRLDSAFVGKTVYSLPDVSTDEQMAKASVFIGSLGGLFKNDTKIPGVRDNDNLMLCNG